MGCALASGCDIAKHRNFTISLFKNPKNVQDNDSDWPIRLVLSSFYLEQGYTQLGIPDGKSDCEVCKSGCESCMTSIAYKPAYEEKKCGYDDKTTMGYTRVHRDVQIINSMRTWLKLKNMTGEDIGLPSCK